MTANEWLEVMKQAQDFPKGMEKLILKYGEMLIKEHDSKVKKLNIPAVIKSLPEYNEILYHAKTLSNEQFREYWNDVQGNVL